jgi:hypothetical protein
MGEEALFEVEPHALDRVQLGRVGRQRHQRDVVGNAQRAGAVPAGLIEHHRDVLVIAVGSRLDGCADVGEREALIAEPRRTLASPPPDVARAPLLPDAGLVLEEEADALVFMRTLYFSEQRWGSF